MSSMWQNGSVDRVRHRKQRARVLARDGYQCQLRLDGCSGRATQLDHMTPNPNPPDEQTQAACASCNQKAGAPEKRNPPVDRPAWLG